MDNRHIIYFLFIFLKNLEFSWVASRLNKSSNIHFAALGAITALSETAGFCFIVSQSQPADFLLWWKENVSLHRFACIGGFIISAALSVFLLFLLLLIKKQLDRSSFRLSACVLFFCSPYLFFLSDSQKMFTVAVTGLLMLFMPLFVSSLFTNVVYLVYKRTHKRQDSRIDFRLGEVLWSLLSSFIGLTAVLLVLIFTSLKIENLLYVNTPESVFLPLTAFLIAVILNFAYLSFGVFKLKSPENRRCLPYAVILLLLNAPYLFLYPIINNMLVNSGQLQGMYAPM